MPSPFNMNHVLLRIEPFLNNENNAQDYQNSAGSDPHRRSFFKKYKRKGESEQWGRAGQDSRFCCSGVENGLEEKETSQSKG